MRQLRSVLLLCFRRFIYAIFDVILLLCYFHSVLSYTLEFVGFYCETFSVVLMRIADFEPELNLVQSGVFIIFDSALCCNFTGFVLFLVPRKHLTSSYRNNCGLISTVRLLCLCSKINGYVRLYSKLRSSVLIK